ncbi:MAG: hypothetical protein HY701_08565 [Gemmatimonadetes bacterium]|nr:hypothetical protein [Gemmatimonadota bacterium]
MSLESWLANGWLTRHEASRQEVDDLLVAAAADLLDAQKDISPAWRFAIAYNAALRLCTAALQAAGYRASREQRHYRTIAALPLVIGPEATELADFLDHCRARRHDVTYEALTAVTESEATALIAAVVELDERIRTRLRSRAQESGRA